MPSPISVLPCQINKITDNGQPSKNGIISKLRPKTVNGRFYTVFIRLDELSQQNLSPSDFLV